MSKDIKKTYISVKTIRVSEMSNLRCSRDCMYCRKTNGNYRCYLRQGGLYDWEEIEGFEGFDDVDDNRYSTADTYGFKRTDYCLKEFGESNDQ